RETYYEEFCGQIATRQNRRFCRSILPERSVCVTAVTVFECPAERIGAETADPSPVPKWVNRKSHDGAEIENSKQTVLAHPDRLVFRVSHRCLLRPGKKSISETGRPSTTCGCDE